MVGYVTFKCDTQLVCQLSSFCDSMHISPGWLKQYFDYFLDVLDTEYF